MSARPSLRIWQLVDSAFPSGGFTHSGGLEAVAYSGDVVTVDDVRRTALMAVRQAGWGGLPFVGEAHRGSSDLAALDAQADAFLNQPVSNRASRTQGAAFFDAARRIFPEAPLASIAGTMLSRRLRCHHAPMFGAILSALDIEIDDTMRLFLYQAARTIVSAGVRLGIIGAFDAQRVQADAAGEIERTLERCRDLEADDAAQTAPIFDLFQSTHDRLYSRLFQS
jgi:urease accessory protein